MLQQNTRDKISHHLNQNEKGKFKSRSELIKVSINFVIKILVINYKSNKYNRYLKGFSLILDIIRPQRDHLNSLKHG